jgi:hypothetical protein
MSAAMKKIFFLPLILAALPLHASEIGHFSPAVMRPRDMTVPEHGAYAALYNTFYTTDTYKDRNGAKAETISIGGTPVNIDVNVNSFMSIPMFLYVTNFKVLGANYGFFAMQPFGNMSVGSALHTTAGRGLSTDNSSFDIGDTFIQPVWLGWNVPQGQLALGYGFYAPTGKYETNSTSNVGLGFWTNQFQAAGTYYLDPHEHTAFTASLTYELHGEKEGTQVTPGDDLSFSLAADHMKKLAKDWAGNAGLSFYGQWQIADDNGGPNPTVHDQVFGAGLNVGLTYLPWKTQIDFHWMQEFEAVDRFEGNFFTLTAGLQF